MFICVQLFKEQFLALFYAISTMLPFTGIGCYRLAKSTIAEVRQIASKSFR